MLLLGDCLDFMPRMRAGSVDLILCDLPYAITKCPWDALIPWEDLWREYHRVLRPSGAVALFGAEKFLFSMINSNLKEYRYRWIWKKNMPSNIANAARMPLRYTEEIAVFYKKQPTFNKQMIDRSEGGISSLKGFIKAGSMMRTTQSSVLLGNRETHKGYVGLTDPNKYSIHKKNPSNVLEFNTPRGTYSKGRIHPTQKPVDLLEYFVRTYTNVGDLVLDNCMGSGSTAIACANLGRRFVGMEKDPSFYQLAVDRINQHKRTVEVIVESNH